MDQTVHYRILRHSQSGPLLGVQGTLECRPTLRRYVNEGDVDLPVSFSAPLVRGLAILELERPDPTKWCWEIFENVGFGLRRYVLFPAPADVIYAGDLIDVDPNTFDPEAEPEAAWWAAIGPLVANVEIVSGELIVTLLDGTVINAGSVGSEPSPELYDSATPPVGAPSTYLRFERDVDGDVQNIYLGTAD